MKFTPGQLNGTYIIDADRHHDLRGYFARVWCEREYHQYGLNSKVVQSSVSYNEKKATLRGMHYQTPPSAEVKTVRCVRGALYDVVVDIRPHSKTFLNWMGVELTAENGRILYIPEGFAHGFQTLEQGTEIFYQMSEFHAPEKAGGFRWNDPRINIQWPLEVQVISERDSGYPDLNPDHFECFRACA